MNEPEILENKNLSLIAVLYLPVLTAGAGSIGKERLVAKCSTSFQVTTNGGSSWTQMAVTHPSGVYGDHL